MRKIIIVLVMIAVVVFIGVGYSFTKGAKLEVIKKTNGTNSKQAIEAVTKEINLETNN